MEPSPSDWTGRTGRVAQGLGWPDDAGVQSRYSERLTITTKRSNTPISKPFVIKAGHSQDHCLFHPNLLVITLCGASRDVPNTRQPLSLPPALVDNDYAAHLKATGRRLYSLSLTQCDEALADVNIQTRQS
jgi:hypothetical protein